MFIQEGNSVLPAHLAGELLAAGYEKADLVKSLDEFSVQGLTDQDGVFEVSTSKMVTPNLTIPESKVQITLKKGRIAEVDPGDSAVLHPTILATVGDRDHQRTPISLKKVSPWLEPAVIAMEDQRFREHSGVDPWGIVRALWHNLRNDSTHGGSTLTQQLAKNLFLNQDRTLHRKVREVFFAAALEQELGKDALLELYFQEVYLGQSGGVPLYGVEAASRAWFGVSAENLTLPEAATLAGVISAPNLYSPLRRPEKAEERRGLVLDRMESLGRITPAQAKEARAAKVAIDGSLPGAIRRAPWAVDEAIDQAENALGEGALASRGLRLHTSIQPLQQRAAERAVAEGLAEVEDQYPKTKGAEAALVAVRVDDGAIVAMVGGRNYAKSPFNRATSAWREIGSTAKPFIDLAAFDADPTLTPLSILDDSPISRTIDGKPWTPENYDGEYRGEVTLREALEGSLNIPAVRLSEQVGLPELQATFQQVGLSKATRYPSAALGGFPATPLELTGAYTVFPGGGTLRKPWLVSGIMDADGNLLVSFKPEESRVVSGRAAALTTSLLEGVITDGTATRAREYGIKNAIGGKTGTTNDYRDAWFVGFTPEIVATAWIGRDRGEGIGLSGSRAALPLWARFMRAQAPSKARFPRPKGLASTKICPESLGVARPQCPSSYQEWFPESAVPTKLCDQHGGFAVGVKNFFEGLFRRRATEPDEAPRRKAKPDSKDPKKHKQ